MREAVVHLESRGQSGLAFDTGSELHRPHISAWPMASDQDLESARAGVRQGATAPAPRPAARSTRCAGSAAAVPEKIHRRSLGDVVTLPVSRHRSLQGHVDNAA